MAVICFYSFDAVGALAAFRTCYSYLISASVSVLCSNSGVGVARAVLSPKGDESIRCFTKVLFLFHRSETLSQTPGFRVSPVSLVSLLFLYTYIFFET